LSFLFFLKFFFREEVHQELQEEAAAAATPNEQAVRVSESEEEDEIQLCYVSSSEDSTADTSDTDEDRRHFERELEANPALRRAYARSEAARSLRGHFNARPGHSWSRRNTRGRETRNPNVLVTNCILEHGGTLLLNTIVKCLCSISLFFLKKKTFSHPYLHFDVFCHFGFARFLFLEYSCADFFHRYRLQI
jgi:hypothetical protein